MATVPPIGFPPIKVTSAKMIFTITENWEVKEDKTGSLTPFPMYVNLTNTSPLFKSILSAISSIFERFEVALKNLFVISQDGFANIEKVSPYSTTLPF